jgi:hypothetical protein
LRNAGFTLASRGTSFNPTPADTWFADGWAWRKTAGITVTHILSRLANNNSVNTPTLAQAGVWIPFAYQFSQSGAQTLPSADWTGVEHRIEGDEWARVIGTQAQLVFWFLGGAAGTYAIAIQNSAQNYGTVLTFTQNAANVWEEKTLTLPAGMGFTQWLSGTGIGARLVLPYMAGAGLSTNSTNQWVNANVICASGAINGPPGLSYMQFAAPRLIPAGAAKSFYLPSPEEAARRVRRYFRRIAGQALLSGIQNGAIAQQSFAVGLGAGMRAQPTVTHNLTDANFVSSAPAGAQWGVGLSGGAQATKTGTVTIATNSTPDQALLGLRGATWSSDIDQLILASGITVDLDAEL